MHLPLVRCDCLTIQDESAQRFQQGVKEHGS